MQKRSAHTRSVLKVDHVALAEVNTIRATVGMDPLKALA